MSFRHNEVNFDVVFDDLFMTLIYCPTVRFKKSCSLIWFIRWCIFFFSSVTFVINQDQWLVYTHTFLFIPKWNYLMSFNDSNDSKICITFNLLLVWITESRLVTMSVSLCTQTVLRHLTIQVLNTRVWFLNIWYTSLTSVHSKLEHGLTISTESFNPLRSEPHNLTYWSPNQKWCNRRCFPICHMY